MKRCSDCGTEKPRAEFTKRTKSSDGLHPYCRECTRKRTNEWLDRNREALNAKRRAQYAENPEPIKKVMHNRYWRDPEARRADTARWREENPEKRKETSRNSYIKNAESRKAKAKAYRLANRDKCLATSRVCGKRHYEKNKDKYYARAIARRAMKSGARGSLSRGIRKRLFAEKGRECVYCGTELGRSAHLDHIIPLAKGGAHTDDNVQLLCPDCNLSKGAKMPEEFIEYRKSQA